MLTDARTQSDSTKGRLLVMLASLVVLITSCNEDEVGAEARESTKPVIRVDLSSSKPEYLLGEPVDLGVIVTNITDVPIQSKNLYLVGDGLAIEIIVFISSDGVQFEEYRMGIYADRDVGRHLETLNPGESREYAHRVFYTYKTRSGLAFETPGIYYVKVEYPLYSWDYPSGRGAFESNSIQITIKAPKGEDAEVWETMQGRGFIHFLQCGWEPLGHVGAPEVAVFLLRNYANSTYAPALRYALKKFYFKNQYSLDPDQRQAIREVLRYTKVEFFSKDQRLDAELSLYLPKKTPLPKAMQRVSEQSGVSLEASEELSERFLVGDVTSKSLRMWMRQQSGYKLGTLWEQRGDGYFLRMRRFPEEYNFYLQTKLGGRGIVPVGQVLSDASRLYHVPLDASADLAERMVDVTESVDAETLMHRLSQELNATWVRRGNGYYLTRKPEKAEPAPADATKSNQKP